MHLLASEGMNVFAGLYPSNACPANTVWGWQYPGGKPRTTEDLKLRYYTVARQLLIAREGGETGIANHVIIKHPFNAEHERWPPSRLSLTSLRMEF